MYFFGGSVGALMLYLYILKIIVYEINLVYVIRLCVGVFVGFSLSYIYVYILILKFKIYLYLIFIKHKK